MSRYRFPAYRNSDMPRYVVVWGPHWELIECLRLEPAANLKEAMATTIARLGADGWVAEATPEYGFTFIRRGHDRRLLMLTPRDPHETGAQAFSPFK